jgi:apoptosis-stimulating of p53 protein 1
MFKFSSSEVKLNNPNASRLADMTLTELQEIAIKQQQQIEINQQLLLAKEKRLKILKLEEQRNQQLSLLSQSSFANNQMMGNPNKTPESSNKLENLKQNVLGQELKIFKLKELRNQILKHKLSNSNMSSELDLIKSLFSKKERELCEAVKNVAELTKQIDQLRKIKTFSNATNGNQFVKSDFKNGQVSGNLEQVVI